jgi:hypothetical protein
MIETFIKGQSGTQPWPLYSGGGLVTLCWKPFDARSFKNFVRSCCVLLLWRILGATVVAVIKELLVTVL